MTGPRSGSRLVRRELGVADRLEDEAEQPHGDADPRPARAPDPTRPPPTAAARPRRTPPRPGSRTPCGRRPRTRPSRRRPSSPPSSVGVARVLAVAPRAAGRCATTGGSPTPPPAPASSHGTQPVAEQRAGDARSRSAPVPRSRRRPRPGPIRRATTAVITIATHGNGEARRRDDSSWLTTSTSHQPRTGGSVVGAAGAHAQDLVDAHPPVAERQLARRRGRAARPGPPPRPPGRSARSRLASNARASRRRCARSARAGRARRAPRGPPPRGARRSRRPAACACPAR